MVNPRIVIVCLAFAFVVFPVNGVAESAAPDQTVIVTPAGVRVTTTPVEEAQSECGGTAPAETYCNTQVHASLAVSSVFLSPGFTGTFTLEVRLFHATSVLVTQVDFVNGEFAGFNTYGLWPTGVFWHECFAYELGTGGAEPKPLPFAENGTPGGDGTWGCGVVY